MFGEGGFWFIGIETLRLLEHVPRLEIFLDHGEYVVIVAGSVQLPLQMVDSNLIQRKKKEKSPYRGLSVGVILGLKYQAIIFRPTGKNSDLMDDLRWITKIDYSNTSTRINRSILAMRTYIYSIDMIL